MAGGAVTAGGGVLAVGAAVLVALISALPLALSGAVPGSAGGSIAASPVSSGPGSTVSDIPPTYLAAFDRAAGTYGVAWSVLAGIYKVECDFGRSPLPGCPRGTRNSAGAEGPGQFLPSTWRRGLALGTIIAPGPPAADGEGYAADGDGDGVADPWDPYDATAATARMLAANGVATDLSGAVFSYNHDPQYVAQVLSLAGGYEQARAALQPPRVPPGGAASPGVGAVLAFADAQIGRPYLWGGSGPAAWDCSGLVQAAYATVGVELTHDAAAQYAATANHPVPVNGLQPGDLIFYGSSPATIHHVGIAVDATHMVDAPFTGAFVRVDSVAAGDLLAATRPLG